MATRASPLLIYHDPDTTSGVVASEPRRNRLSQLSRPVEVRTRRRTGKGKRAVRARRAIAVLASRPAHSSRVSAERALHCHATSASQRHADDGQLRDRPSQPVGEVGLGLHPAEASASSFGTRIVRRGSSITTRSAVGAPPLGGDGGGPAGGRSARQEPEHDGSDQVRHVGLRGSRKYGTVGPACWTWCDPEAVHASADAGANSEVARERRRRPDPAHPFAAADDSARRSHSPILPRPPETDMAYLIVSIVFWLLAR